MWKYITDSNFDEIDDIIKQKIFIEAQKRWDDLKINYRSKNEKLICLMKFNSCFYLKADSIIYDGYSFHLDKKHNL